MYVPIQSVVNMKPTIGQKVTSCSFPIGVILGNSRLMEVISSLNVIGMRNLGCSGVLEGCFQRVGNAFNRRAMW